MIDAAEAKAWAEAVLRSSTDSLRAAYARLCCAFEDGPEGACSACGQWRTEHHAEWVAKFIAGVAGDSAEALREARSIAKALNEHEEMKRFFVAGPRQSHFVLWCVVLGQDPEAVRRALRGVLFFPWSPRVLRGAVSKVIRGHSRERVRRYRERKRGAA